MSEAYGKIAVLFGGGIGAGKTTLYQRLSSRHTYRGLSRLPWISADAFPSDIPHVERSQRAELVLEAAVQQGQSFVWEATFGWSPSERFAAGELEEIWLGRLRAHGYQICFHGVIAPENVTSKRIRLRELQSARTVDAEWRIGESAALFLANVSLIKKHCHRFRLWSNASVLRPYNCNR